MVKEFNKFKIITIFLLLLFSSLAMFCSTGRSGPLDQIYECEPFIELKYNESILDQPIKPYEDPIEIPLKINARIIGPVADIVKNNLAGDIYLIIDLSIENISKGCYASVTPPLVRYPGISEEYQSANTTLSITIDKDFPAFSLKNVVLNASVRRMGNKATLVKAKSFFIDIPFKVDYLSQLSFSYPEKNVKNINPQQTAVFPIEIENWGNAESKVNIEVVDVPKGWQASIKENLTLGSSLFNGDAKEIVSLNVKPPIDSGYHEDRAIIKVKMTPVFYKNSSIAGEPHYLYFIVQSKGVSTPGFEFIVILGAFCIVFYPLWKKNRKERWDRR